MGPLIQVRSLLTQIEVEVGAAVLDACGSTGDAVEAVLSARGMHVTTNDSNSRCVYHSALVNSEVAVNRAVV